MRAGDRILSINGKPVTSLQPIDVPKLQEFIAELPIDSTVALRIERDGKPRDISLKAAAQTRERGKELALAPYGISASELTQAMSRRRNLDTDSGILVTGVRPGGPAAAARPELKQRRDQRREWKAGIHACRPARPGVGGQGEQTHGSPTRTQRRTTAEPAHA